MPVPTDITAGTISISGSTITGVGTSFLASDIRQGDLFIWIEGGAGQWSPIVQTVTSNTVLTLAEPWTGPTISGARYRLRYQWDSSRVSAQSRQMIEMLDNGNVLALAGLTGPGVPVFDGPHSMTVQPVSDFINGVAYNVQVDTLADRAAYDGQAAGYSVLVSNVGDGRSAVYSKASNTSGDWTDPAYITGPLGPLPDVEATVATGAPGSTATVDEVPITGGVRLDFTLPAAEGFYNAGVYDSGTAYITDQVVRHNGSSFLALQAVPAGTSPSSAFPPVDTAFWQVLAARGANGAGTVTEIVAGTNITVDNTDPTAPVISATSDGDMIGPPASTAKNLVQFSDTGGKVTEDAGVSVPGISPVFGPRLTLTQGVSVTTSDVAGATHVYVEPASYGADVVVLPDATDRVPYRYSSIDVLLSTTRNLANSGYDVWVGVSSGLVVAGTGPAWSSIALGSASRGSGAGTTEIEFWKGMWVNKNPITVWNGVTSYTFAARCALLVGSIATVLAGQTEDSFLNRYVSNVFATVRRNVKRNDPALSWSYSTATWRRANNNSLNAVNVFQCLSGRQITLKAMGAFFSSTVTNQLAATGIGRNVTNANSAQIMVPGLANNTGFRPTFAEMVDTCDLGLTSYSLLEKGAGADAQTWNGVNADVSTGIVGSVDV